MKSVAVLVLAAAAAAVAEKPVFNAKNFAAGCKTDGSCYWKFDVYPAGGDANKAIHCEKSLSASSLPDIADGPCADTSITFDVYGTESGWTVRVEQSSKKLVGYHPINYFDVKAMDNNKVFSPTYIGGTSFTLNE